MITIRYWGAAFLTFANSGENRMSECVEELRHRTSLPFRCSLLQDWHEVLYPFGIFADDGDLANASSSPFPKLAIHEVDQRARA